MTLCAAKHKRCKNEARPGFKLCASCQAYFSQQHKKYYAKRTPQQRRTDAQKHKLYMRDWRIIKLSDDELRHAIAKATTSLVRLQDEWERRHS